MNLKDLINLSCKNDGVYIIKLNYEDYRAIDNLYIFIEMKSGLKEIEVYETPDYMDSLKRCDFFQIDVEKAYKIKIQKFEGTYKEAIDYIEDNL